MFFGLDFWLFLRYLGEYRQIPWHLNLIYLPLLLDSKAPAWSRSWTITQFFVISPLWKLFYGRKNRFITIITSTMSELTFPVPNNRYDILFLDGKKVHSFFNLISFLSTEIYCIIVFQAKCNHDIEACDTLYSRMDAFGIFFFWSFLYWRILICYRYFFFLSLFKVDIQNHVIVISLVTIY